MVNIEYWPCDSLAGANVCLSIAGSSVDYRSDFIFGFYPMMKKIVLIGAGNVATHLGSALCGAGYDVVQIYSRTKESAMELAGKLSTEYTVSIDDIRCDADMYIVALKDSALQELLPLLVKGREQAFFVHTAGSMPMDIWKGYLSHYGVFYPMQTFSKQRAVDFATVPFFVEAGGEAELNTESNGIRSNLCTAEVSAYSGCLCLQFCESHVCTECPDSGKTSYSF